VLTGPEPHDAVVTLEAAAANLRDALEVLGPAQHSARAALLNDLGELLRREGDIVGARQAFLDAARHARSVGDAELLGQAALGYGLGSGGLHRALRCDLQHIALLEEALSALGPVESPLRVRLLARLAEELYFTPEVSARSALGSEAIARARRIGDPAVLLPALHARELGHVGPDVPLDERIADAGELIALADELGDEEASYLGHMLRELAYREAGRRHDAVPDLEAAEALANRVAVPGLLAWAATARARQHWLAGRFAEAEADNARAMTHALEKGGDPDVANLVVGGQLLAMQILRVDLGQFVPSLLAYRHEYPHFTILRCFTAYALAESGDTEAAGGELSELSQHGLVESGRNAEWPGTMWALSRVASSLGETRIAAQLYADLAFCSGRWFADWVSICLGPVDTALGMLAALTNAHDVADTHFEDAQRQALANEAPPWHADAQVQHATALLRRGGAAARTKAEELLTEAVVTCDRVGLEALGARARSLLS
jgi:tetratricopeptide (TPR) repeat protein